MLRADDDSLTCAGCATPMFPAVDKYFVRVLWSDEKPQSCSTTVIRSNTTPSVRNARCIMRFVARASVVTYLSGRPKRKKKNKSKMRKSIIRRGIKNCRGLVCMCVGNDSLVHNKLYHNLYRPWSGSRGNNKYRLKRIYPLVGMYV
jgi:hypothetical protein